MIPLGLGGTNEIDNLAPAHEVCAASKTFGKGDNSKIAKAKRQKMHHLGIAKKGPKIQSRGFPKYDREKKQTTKAMPRRSIYEEIQ